MLCALLFHDNGIVSAELLDCMAAISFVFILAIVLVLLSDHNDHNKPRNP